MLLPNSNPRLYLLLVLLYEDSRVCYGSFEVATAWDTFKVPEIPVVEARGRLCHRNRWALVTFCFTSLGKVPMLCYSVLSHAIHAVSAEPQRLT